MTSSHGQTPRPLRTWQIWLTAVAVMTGLAVAASSDPVTVWTNPEPADAAPPPAGADVEDPITPPAPDPAERAEPDWLATVMEIVAIAVFGLIILLGVFASTQLRSSFRAWRRARQGRRERFADPLPDSAADQLEVDADAARVWLSEGPARNAIVACWIQLEGDVAAAGLPRYAAETSSEYVERVIGEASVDAAPISELAALYREARFSEHDLGTDHRARATAALDRVIAALGRYDRVGV